MRCFVPLAVVVIALGTLAVFESPGPVLGQDETFQGCTAGLSSTPAATDASPEAQPDVTPDPDIVVRGVPVGDMFGTPTAALWLQRFTIGSNGPPVVGCLRGFTLVWVMTGEVNVELYAGCVELPPYDVSFLPGIPDPNSDVKCGPENELRLVENSEQSQALLIDAGVEFMAVSDEATIVMSAIEPDWLTEDTPPCPGRWCGWEP
jgi:hypothetical protein